MYLFDYSTVTDFARFLDLSGSAGSVPYYSPLNFVYNFAPDNTTTVSFTYTHKKLNGEYIEVTAKPATYNLTCYKGLIIFNNNSEKKAIVKK